MINRIVLSVGHGGISGEKYDPGAVDQKTKAAENVEARQICDRLVKKLQTAGINVLYLPDYSYVKSINEVNRVYQPGDWAIEVHKDSFGTYDPTNMRRRCGVYYYHASQAGKLVAEGMRRMMINAGAHHTSWARPDNVSNHGGLGWNTMTRPLAHLMEMGFIQDGNSDADDEWYAQTLFLAIQDAVKNF